MCKFFINFLLFFSFAFNLFAAENATDDQSKIETENQLQESVLKIENAGKQNLEPKNTLYIELKDGIVVAELLPNIAPRHVQRIRELTADGFYDNVKFHRVISNFMAQTGDPTGTGRGGSKMGRLYAEFSNEKHVRGILSMARSSDKDSANSQFFIVTGPSFPQLDGQYTVFGRVIEGMEYVDRIKAGNPANNGNVVDPDVMITVLTGDLLNNKSLPIIREEIKLVNELQDAKIKEDPQYKKQSILLLLLNAKDIDIRATEEKKNETPPSTNQSTTQPATSTDQSTSTPSPEASAVKPSSPEPATQNTNLTPPSGDSVSNSTPAETK